jgi:protein gp37
MGTNSAIEWTDATWNPVTGCTKISPGCANCYAQRMAKRLQAMGQANYADGFNVTMHDRAVELPLGWKKPRAIFVNSMSDLFHENVPVEFILRIFDVMRRADWHKFQILTKRSQRLLELEGQLPWLPHVWMGVSVESQEYVGRINDLRQTHAHTKFLSLEPLLGPLPNLDLSGIDWVIVGGESGPGHRPMKPAWVTGIRDQCNSAGVPFFFKQWGGVNKKRAGRQLDGRTWDEMPRSSSACLKKPNRQFPANSRRGSLG